MLQPSPYPEDHPRLLKLEAIQTQAEWLGKAVSFYRTPLTTFFRRERNHVGVMMQENRGSGNESTGLDDGSKNTVATTYLTDAWNWGAEIFCGCEVRYIEQAPNQEGYVVYFAWHGRGRSAFGEEVKTQLFWVKAVGLVTSIYQPALIGCHLPRTSCVSLGPALWGQRRFCFAQETTVCQFHPWREGICQGTGTCWSLVSLVDMDVDHD